MQFTNIGLRYYRLGSLLAHRELLISSQKFKDTLMKGADCLLLPPLQYPVCLIPFSSAPLNSDLCFLCLARPLLSFAALLS